MDGKDICNLVRHCEINGVNQLSSDAARLEELNHQASDMLEQIAEISQHFSWVEGLRQHDLWLNMYDITMQLEQAVEKYNSAVKIAEASLIMRKFDNLQQC